MLRGRACRKLVFGRVRLAPLWVEVDAVVVRVPLHVSLLRKAAADGASCAIGSYHATYRPATGCLSCHIGSEKQGASHGGGELVQRILQLQARAREHERARSHGATAHRVAACPCQPDQ